MINKKILYIDDDADSRLLLEVLFCSHNCTVLGVSSALEGVNLAQKEHIDAVILDYIMPEMDGAEVCRRIRQFNRQTPVVFFTASARRNELDRLINCGAQAALVKPNDLEELVPLVLKLIKNPD